MQQFGEFFLNHWELFLALILILAMLASTSFSSNLRGFKDLEPMQAVQKMNHDNALVVDIRENNEINEGMISGSRHMPLSTLADKVDQLTKDKDRPMLVVCRSGQRSAKACGILRKQGFEPLYSLKGGIMAWENASYPLEKNSKKKKKS
ncbi:MAG: rhodanese-like domain-containing protein [Gammaproteobacteria bacterium]|nr:rhodanese-like domain-containing protein [Gammaproteobacteria bacterium]